MQSVGKSRLRQAPLAVALALAVLVLCKSEAAAFDLFARHEVSVQFATADGKPMANAEVRVFAPGDPTHPVQTGRTDAGGKFAFPADRDGLWSAEARSSDEVARATIRVGGPASGPADTQLSPYVIYASLGLLLVLALGFRFLRARSRRR
jgi:hypothetical protein